MKKLNFYQIAFIIFLIVGLFIFIIRLMFGGDEDTWLCQNGQWVKHGQPSAPLPTSECPINLPTK